MKPQEIMNEFDIKLGVVLQQLSDLSVLATHADLSGDQLSDFIEKKHEGVVKLVEARNMFANYLGVENILTTKKPAL